MTKQSGGGVDARAAAVRRLTSAFGVSVFAQAVSFLAIVFVLHFAAHAILDASAASGGVAPSAGVALAAVIAEFVIALFFALFISFVASRRLVYAIVRATPPPSKPPVRPVPFAALCAAAIVVAVSLAVFAASPDAFAAGGLGWLIQLVREAAFVGAFWIGSTRAVFPVTTR